MALSPLIREIVEESERAGFMNAIVEVLQARFGAVTPSVTAGLQQVAQKKKLAHLTRQAALCPSLEAFEESLRQTFPAPPPPSTRGKRRSRKPPP